MKRALLFGILLALLTGCAGPELYWCAVADGESYEFTAQLADIQVSSKLDRRTYVFGTNKRGNAYDLTTAIYFDEYAIIEAGPCPDD